jgi:acyl-CoA reductase-like NAD-dependent aldehyde dehydrogenase
LFVTDLAKFEGEVRMLIDGDLVEAASGKRFDNINPATEEVLGQVADADKTDMGRAIAAARRAFDETDWSTNRSLRKRCLEQLQEAMEAEQEEMRAELVAEVGAPVQVTYGPQLDLPLADAFRWPAKTIDEFPWERDLPDGQMFGMTSRRKVWKEAMGVVGCIVPWNFPFEVTSNKLGQVPKGFFVEPTVFADVDNSMTIAREEIFGPVLVVIPFDDDEDALRITNDNQYGLSGGVWSGSEERATSFARRVRAGTVSINGGQWYGADSPYGGYKASGIGRQNGLEGFEQYLETKAVGLPPL